MPIEDRQAPEARARHPASEAIGVSGLRQFSGYIREEFLRTLEGRKGREIFDEMSKNDSTCGALLFAIRNTLRSLEWTVKPSDPSSEAALEMAELVEGMLFRDMEHTWPEFIDSVCSMFAYGFSLHEMVWKQRKGWNAAKPWLSSEFDDGLWAPRAFPPRGQKTIERWIYDGEENLIGVVQRPWTEREIVIPMRRCLHFRTTAELGNPEGQSLLRTAYRSWYWLKRLQEIEGIGSERDLAGYPVLRVPGDMLSVDADAEQIKAKQGYENFLRQVRRDQNEGVLLPSDRDEKGNLFYEFELISSGGTRQMDISASCRRYQEDIARSVMADFMFLGSDGGGSLALGKTKVQFFAEALKGYAHHITSQINEDAIPAIWRMNGLDFDLMPKVDPGDIEKVDLDQVAAYVTSLAGAGYDLATDTELENHLRSIAELPAAPNRIEDDDYIPMPSGRAKPEPEEPPEPGGAPPQKGGSRSEKGEPDDDEKALSKALRAAYGSEADEPAAFDWRAAAAAFEEGL